MTALCTCNGEVLEKSLALPARGTIALQSETNVVEYRRIPDQGNPSLNRLVRFRAAALRRAKSILIGDSERKSHRKQRLDR